MTNDNAAGRMVDGRSGAFPWTTSAALLCVALPLAIVVAVAGTLYGTQRVESSLTEQTHQYLVAADLNDIGLDVDFNHRDGTISGRLPDGVTVDDVRMAVNDDDIRSLNLTGLVSEDTVDDNSQDAAPPVSDAPLDTAAPTTAGPATTTPETTSPDTTTPENPVTDTTAPETTIPATTAPAPTTTEAPVTTGPEDDEPVDGPAGGEVVALQEELDAIADDIREGVVFATSSDDLDNEGRAALDAVVELLETYPAPALIVTGHTDDRGSEDTNLKLSTSRAESVRFYLIGQGISSSRIRFAGAGESQPIADNSTLQGQAENRRVQFTALETFE